MNLTHILLGSSLIALPFLAQAQFNTDPGDAIGTIGGDNFVVDVFMRTTTDYSGATYLGNGSWSGDIDVVVSSWTRFRQEQDDATIMNMLRDWKNLSDQELLAQIRQEQDNFKGPEDCSQTLGLIDFVRDALGEIANTLEGRTDLDSGDLEHEWGSALVTEDGNTTIYRGSIYTDWNDEEVRHLIAPSDIPNIVTIIHNHPMQGHESAGINLENRYPSDDDWDEADRLVKDKKANPDVLALTIIDPFGEARVFPYSDRNIYRNQTRHDRTQGRDLPPEVPEDADHGNCVTL